VDTLAALRAAPTRAEFSGEANIMAEFRALAEFQALGLREAQHSAGPADTLELHAMPADPGPRRAARHRARRHIPPVSWRAGTLMGVAAAAVIVIAVAFFGNLPGPILRITHLRHVSTVSHPSLQGTGSKDKTTKAKPSGSHPTAVPSSTWSPPPTPSTSPSPSELCRSYYASFLHPEYGAAEMSLGRKLATLAGGADPGQLYRFCRQYLGHNWHYPRTDDASQANPGQNSQSQTGGTSQPAPGQPGSGSSPPATQSGAGASQSTSQSTQSAAGSGQGSQNGEPTPNPPSPDPPSPVSSPAP
jgi:hypothetical protein